MLFPANKKPVIESLKRVSPTEVRVEWSQPPGGVNVTGYVVLYYDGSVTRNQTVPGTDSSTIVTVVPHIVSYSISVMALSEESYLSGRSAWKNISLCEYTTCNNYYTVLYSYTLHSRESRRSVGGSVRDWLSQSVLGGSGEC